MQLGCSSPGYREARIIPIADGDRGTAQTIDQIRILIDAGMKCAQVNSLALSIVRGLPAFNYAAERRAIYDWVLGNIRYVRHIFGKETLRTVGEILDKRAGHCSDFTVLCGALLGTIGNQVRLVTVATDPGSPSEWTHIYPEVLDDGQWVAIDAARPGARWGLAPQSFFRKRIWSAYSPEYADVNGAGMGALQRRTLNGLGDTADILQSILDAAPKILQGTATIVQAANGPVTPYYYTPLQQESPYGSQYGAAVNLSASPGLSSLTSNPLVLLGAGLLLFMALKGRG
jgi:hypothetical protein